MRNLAQRELNLVAAGMTSGSGKASPNATPFVGHMYRGFFIAAGAAVYKWVTEQYHTYMEQQSKPDSDNDNNSNGFTGSMSQASGSPVSMSGAYSF